MSDLFVSALEIFYALIGGDFGTAGTESLSGSGLANLVFGSI